MRVVLVTGSRSWPDDHIVWGVLSEQVREHGPFVLVHGGMPVGVDALAHEWLYLEDPVCNLPCCDPQIQLTMRQLEESYPVNIAAEGIDGIAARNQRMVDRSADVCLAFIGPESRSSIDCLTRARIAGIPVVEHGHEADPQSEHALCCSVCAHPAVEHDQTGCHVYGSFDECTCAGYSVDSLDLV